MEYIFSSYEDFLNEYQNYRFDECSVCHSICELEETLFNCYIEGRRLIFHKILILRCKSCGATFLPEHTKQMIDGAYKMMIEHEQSIGEFTPRGYKEKFEYCNKQDFEYDHRDYYNIPGLSYDEERSAKGFLTPYISKKKRWFISLLFLILRWRFFRRATDTLQRKM